MADVEVEGLSRLFGQLKRLGLESDDLKDAWDPLSTEVVAKAKRIVPRRTGKLAGSIRSSRAQNSVTVRAGGARVPYAWFVYRGSVHNPDPVPFIRLAVEDTDVEGYVQRAIALLINRVM